MNNWMTSGRELFKIISSRSSTPRRSLLILSSLPSATAAAPAPWNYVPTLFGGWPHAVWNRDMYLMNFRSLALPSARPTSNVSDDGVGWRCWQTSER